MIGGSRSVLGVLREYKTPQQASNVCVVVGCAPHTTHAADDTRKNERKKRVAFERSSGSCTGRRLDLFLKREVGMNAENDAACTGR